MTVGEALAEARSRAGLTVDEVSERTRIRQAVIRCIEQDDYDACGGDLYVRGYVRAIAGAVGIDAQPLIREFDAGNVNASDGGTRTAAAPDVPGTPAGPPVPSPDPALTIADPEFRLPDPDYTIADPGFTLAGPYPEGHAPAYPDSWGHVPADPDPGYMVAEPVYRLTDAAFGRRDAAFIADDPAPTIVDSFDIPRELALRAPAPAAYGRPAEPSAWRKRTRGRLKVTGIAFLLVVAAAAVGVAGNHIVSALRNGSAEDKAATIPQRTAQPGSSPGRVGGAQAPTGTPKSPSASPAPSITKAPRVSAPPVLTLPVASAVAFGPGGMGDGDNPQIAMDVITPGSPSPWQTDWYTTAAFGQLKNGTGLLLDMGRTVTITSVRLDLSPYDGANLQLRAGGAAALGDLPVAASATDVGGTVRLPLAAPVHARYLLVWFTLLPPDGSGTFQESVYRVVVHGRA